MSIFFTDTYFLSVLTYCVPLCSFSGSICCHSSDPAYPLEVIFSSTPHAALVGWIFFKFMYGATLSPLILGHPLVLFHIYGVLIMWCSHFMALLSLCSFISLVALKIALRASTLLAHPSTFFICLLDCCQFSNYLSHHLYHWSIVL